MSPSCVVGWSRAWAASLAARTLDGAAVERSLVELVAGYFCGNLLATHPPLRPEPKLKAAGCDTRFAACGMAPSGKTSNSLARFG